MTTQKYLVRTMSDTVETDIRRVHVIANEVLDRYRKDPLSFEQLRKIADGPFDLFLIPLVFEKDYSSKSFRIIKIQLQKFVRCPSETLYRSKFLPSKTSRQDPDYSDFSPVA